jgi:hypothetical protein
MNSNVGSNTISPLVVDGPCCHGGKGKKFFVALRTDFHLFVSRAPTHDLQRGGFELDCGPYERLLEVIDMTALQ